MMIKEKNITWIPPLKNNEDGWLAIGGVNWFITNWHHFDDFGQTFETVTARHPSTRELIEVYSNDEGLTWSLDLD